MVHFNGRTDQCPFNSFSFNYVQVILAPDALALNAAGNSGVSISCTPGATSGRLLHHHDQAFGTGFFYCILYKVWYPFRNSHYRYPGVGPAGII